LVGKNIKTATFGAGCFWSVQDTFQKTKGVINTIAGYMGGDIINPTYEQVCTDKTGHVEVVQVEYDPSVISYNELLNVFWNMHDPTQEDRQGPDIGKQYRSVIFYHNENQKKIAEESKNNLEKTGKFNKPIATEITQVETFYPAEEYHQNYFEKNGMIGCGI